MQTSLFVVVQNLQNCDPKTWVHIKPRLLWTVTPQATPLTHVSVFGTQSWGTLLLKETPNDFRAVRRWEVSIRWDFGAFALKTATRCGRNDDLRAVSANIDSWATSWKSSEAPRGQRELQIQVTILCGFITTCDLFHIMWYIIILKLATTAAYQTQWHRLENKKCPWSKHLSLAICQI